MLDIFKIKGAQRSVKVKKNIIAMIGIKGISLGISLLYVPRSEERRVGKECS